MTFKKWEAASLDRELAARLSEEFGLQPFLGMMLAARRASGEQQVRELLDGAPLSDPFLMKDMDKAVERIRRALDEFEKIAVYGDYDADGVTATAMLFSYLESMGADVVYYIPQREGEGYGMNRNAVETLHRQGVKLIVTVDNGISSVEEVALANELGMDVVVTDHHRPQERLPEAVAVVDAYRSDDESPFRDFCGAGVVLKLLMALEEDREGILEEYGDLAAIGTVADVVPLLSENRTIVRAGLRLIARGGRPGVDALIEQAAAGRSMTATNLAFTVIPRINATGRMGAPERAVRLLTCEDEEAAGAMAAEICADNERRRQVEADILEEADRLLRTDPALQYDRVLVVSGENWHHGVLGIVAGRLEEKYGKPCIVISQDGESAKGSGRSVEGFSMFQAVYACRDLFERFGGHPMACGVTMRSENIPVFRERINSWAREHCPQMPAPVLRLDCRLNPAALSPEMPRALEALEPFGNGNEAPLFGLYNVELRNIVPVGNGNHLRLTVEKNGAEFKVMRFGMRAEEFPFAPGARLDLAVQLEAREYRGEDQLTVNVRDVKLSDLDMEACIRGLRYYEKYKRRERLRREELEELLPVRDDLAALYRLLKAWGGRPVGIQGLLGALKPEDPGKSFGTGKLMVCFDILEERGLADCGPRGDLMTIRLLPTEGKVDILASPVAAILKALAER